MKKLLFTAATAMLCFFVSCNDSTTTDTKDGDAQADNKAKLEMIHRALETGDVSKLDSIIDKDIVDHGSPTGDVKGIDSVKKWFVEFHNNTKDVKVESIATAINGDYSFDLNKMTGTFTNAFMGMPAGPFEMTAVDVVKLKNGKATDHWGYMDPKEMMKMMGGDHPMDAKMDNKMAPQDSSKK